MCGHLCLASGLREAAHLYVFPPALAAFGSFPLRSSPSMKIAGRVAKNRTGNCDSTRTIFRTQGKI
jgi:hypothetical protein